MTPEELQALFDPDVQELIEKHIGDDPAAFAMKFHDRNGLPVRAIAEQIACRHKAAKKLPNLSLRNLLYTTLSLEQASGERTAHYKSGLEEMAGKKLLDMTGGLGVDSTFFANRFEEVIYVERDEVLAEVASHNFRELGINNITIIRGDSTELLEVSSDNTFDWIFLDPARREKGKRSVSLEDAEPNVVKLHDLLLCKARKLCVKASPALEISALREKLPSLSQVLVLSVDRECKEVLLFCEREKADEPVVVKAVCLGRGGETFFLSDKEAGRRKRVAGAGAYFYEPDPAIIKARLTAVLAEHYELQFINPTIDYLTSGRKIERFPGRSFRVMAALPYKPRVLKSFLKEHGIAAASIQRRDFPLSPDEIRRIYCLKESDEHYLFFLKDSRRRLLCLYCGCLY